MSDAAELVLRGLGRCGVATLPNGDLIFRTSSQDRARQLHEQLIAALEAIETEAAAAPGLRAALERIAKGTERIATMLEADYLVRMPAHTKLPKVRP